MLKQEIAITCLSFILRANVEIFAASLNILSYPFVYYKILMVE